MSQDHLVDSPVKLARCNRCQAYVWLAMASGVRSAADVAPATHQEWIAAVADGRRTFALARRAGRPARLLTRRLGDSVPTFGPGGAQQPVEGRPEVVVEHGCGGHARNMLTFQEVEQQQAATVCDTWKASGWVPPPGKCQRDRGRDVVSCATCDKPPFDLAEAGLGAPESLPRAPEDPRSLISPSDPYHQPGKGQSWSSPMESAARPGAGQGGPTAPAVTRPSTATEGRIATAPAPSVSTAGASTLPTPVSYSVMTESGTRTRPGHSYSGAATKAVRCDTCRKLIDQGKPFYGISYDNRWVWANCEECE